MIKTAIIGLGPWGCNYLRIFSKSSAARLVGVADLRPDRLAWARENYPEIPVYQSSDDLLDKEKIDAAVISVQAEAHYPIIKKSLAMGLDVLAEKPMTIKTEQARELLNLAEEKNSILMVGHTFMFNDAVRKMKEFIQNGRIGDIYYMHAVRTHLGPIREDVNAVWDLAAHDISIFHYFLDHLPISVSAVGEGFLKKERADVAFITLKYPGGVIGNIHVSWINSNKVREVTVVGSKGRIVFDDLDNLEKIRIFEKGISINKSVDNFGEFQYLLRDGDIVSPKLELKEPLKNQCSEFIRAVQSRKSPISDGRIGLMVVDVLQAVEESLKNDGCPVAPSVTR